MSYYKIIDGQKFDRALLETAETLIQGQGDGRLSVDDAGQIMTLLKDAGTYTDIEKASVAYLKLNYNWTAAAEEWLDRALEEFGSSRT